MSDQPYRMSDEDREALAEAAYHRKVAWSRTAITPWTGLAPFQRQQQQDRAVESTVEAIVAREVAAALAPIKALADEYARDEAEHVDMFGQHHPVAWNAERHLRDALGEAS